MDAGGGGSAEANSVGDNGGSPSWWHCAGQGDRVGQGAVAGEREASIK